MNPEQQITQALGDLLKEINRPADIAERLYEFGVKGHKRCDDGCALANYLKQRTGLDVMVNPVWNTAGRPGWITWDDTDPQAYVYMDYRLNQFALNFDTGSYPELEDPTQEPE
jgi:hypothetical protein